MKLPWQRMSKEQKLKEENFLKYFKIEVNEDTTKILMDIDSEDVKRWLYSVTRTIQRAFAKNGIQNYLAGQFIIGGQRIEFAFLRDFKESPHELRMKAENRVKELEERLKKYE